MLANIYLHYALDLWFERVVKKWCKGDAMMFRYADDFVLFSVLLEQKPQRQVIGQDAAIDEKVSCGAGLAAKLDQSGTQPA